MYIKMEQWIYNVIFGIVVVIVIILVIIIYIRGNHELTNEYIIRSTTYQSASSTLQEEDENDDDNVDGYEDYDAAETARGLAGETEAEFASNITGFSFPIVLDSSKNWPIRTEKDKFVFPSLGYYQINGTIPIYAGTSVGTTYREVYIIKNGNNSKRYTNSLLMSTGTSFHTFSCLVPCTTIGDYIQICYWCSAAGTTSTGDPKNSNSCELQIQYVDSL